MLNRTVTSHGWLEESSVIMFCKEISSKPDLRIFNDLPLGVDDLQHIEISCHILAKRSRKSLVSPVRRGIVIP